MTQAGQTCPIPSLPEWIPSEQLVWKCLCKGEIADFNADEKLEPSNCTGWDDRRTVRAVFLETILLQEPYRSALPRQGVRIVGAWCKEAITLEFARLGFMLELKGMRFEQEVQLEALNSTDSLSLAGSYFAQSLTMSGSQIERHLDLGGVHCAGKLDLEGLEVKGSLFMDSKHNQRAQFAEVVLDSARIGGRLSLRWACCTGKIDLHSARIGGRLSLRETHFKRPLDLHNVQIGGHLNLDNARCTGKLDLHNVQIGGDLDLRRARFKGPLDLHNARIGGDLYLHYAHFKGLLNLTGASLRGELHLGEGNKAMPQWNMDAQLVLRNATLRAIQCPPELKAWPAKLELGGCTYQQLGGSSSADPGADMAGRPPKWFIDWLASDQTFSPQPYQQLASVLRSMGHAETADAVLYQGKERERRDMGWRSLKWWGMSLLNWTIGYGYGYRYLLVRQVKSGSLGEEDLTPP